MIVQTYFTNSDCRSYILLNETEIIACAKKDFNVDLDRDSIVLALSKKVKSGRMFKRVEASTFAILNAEEKQSP